MIYADDVTEWDSGGISMCPDCRRVTIVRTVERDYLDEPIRTACRPCALGEWDDWDFDDERGAS